MPLENDELKVWVLTPANIPEYCKKSGASMDDIMAKYREANSQNKILYGYIASENEFFTKKD